MVKKITIAGAGTMGYSMAQIFAEYGYEVILWNRKQDTLDKAKTKIAAGVVDKITYMTDLSAFKGRDIIIENVAENLDIKLDFYRMMSLVADETTIIATNTSGLSINSLAAAVEKPERFLGMHWFNPPTLIPLIEIIKNDQTTDEAAKEVYNLAVAIDKKPAIVEKDVYGFAANRIQMAVLREVSSLVEHGVISPEGADAVMKYGLGFRWACLGPFETIDFGGIDIFDHLAEYLVPDLEDSHEIPKVIHDCYEAGNYGVKTGKGVYDYADGRAEEATRERDRKLKALYEALYYKMSHGD